MLRAGEVLFPGAADFIRSAAAAVPIAIASGALRHEIEEILDATRLRSHFPAIVASGDTPQSKPSPAPYRAGVPAAAADARRPDRPESLRRHRRLAMGTGIGARRRIALCWRHQQLPGREAARGGAGRRGSARR